MKINSLPKGSKVNVDSSSTPKTFINLFYDQLKKNPNQVAVQFESKSISYAELDRQSSYVAAFLKSQGVNEKSVIPILINRSTDLMISIIGILKLSCAYLPIDPSYPQERISHIIKDSASKLLLTTKELQPTAESLNVSIINFDDIDFTCDLDFSEVTIDPNSLAYIIYTSASTGKPKGVMITHFNLANFIAAMQEVIPFVEGKKLLMLAPISFDLSISETLLPLASGVTVYIGNKEEQQSPDQFNTCIVQNNISMVHCTASRLKVFLSSAQHLSWLREIRHLMVGGEAFPEKTFIALKKLYTGKIYNLYGPTETTVWSTFKDLTDSNELTIGKPILNTYIYIVDDHGQLISDQTPGEIWIGGNGVARGYINNDELTRQKFIANPFESTGNVYKTGDQGKWLPNGEIDFLGRADFQVKVRGFRIELSEIEEAISKMESIDECVVTVKRSTTDEQFVCAYIISKLPVNFEEIKNALRLKLPEYMLPTFFHQLKEIPLTSNGKIDFRSLPFSDLSSTQDIEIKWSDSEIRLRKIWEQTLGIPIYNNELRFFDIGGNSLNGIILINLIWREFNVKISFMQLFQNSSIRALSWLIENSANSQPLIIPKVDHKLCYNITAAQRRIYISQFIDNDSIGYNMPQYFSADLSFDVDKFERVLKLMVQRHESFRTYFNFDGDHIMQYVVDANSVDFTIERLEVEAEKLDLFLQSLVKPFSLGTAPLLKVFAIHVKGARDLFIMIDMHHIISDGFSLRIFWDEVIALMNGEKLKKLNIFYKDYAEWLVTNQSEVYKIQENFWTKNFASPIRNLELSFAKPIPNNLSQQGAVIQFELNEEIVSHLTDCCQEYNVTPNILLFSLFALTIFDNTNQDDIVIGTIVAGRNNLSISDVIGVFANFLPIRITYQPNESFSSFIYRFRNFLLSAYENQDYPFDELINKLNIKRETDRNPLFNIMFVFHNEIKHNLSEHLKQIGLKKYSAKSNISLLDLKLDIFQNDTNKFTCNLYYKTQVFEEKEINRFVDQFLSFLTPKKFHTKAKM